MAKHNNRMAKPINQQPASVPKPRQGGPLVDEKSAQCWNCGSIDTLLIQSGQHYRAIKRLRKCANCGTVFESLEVLRYGARV
jgi:hypothetical protein